MSHDKDKEYKADGLCHFIKQKHQCKPVRCVNKTSSEHILLCSSHMYLSKKYSNKKILDIYKACGFFSKRTRIKIKNIFRERDKKKNKGTKDKKGKDPKENKEKCDVALLKSLLIMGLNCAHLSDINLSKIKVAYRLRSLLLHPDKNLGISSATINMQELNTARDTLISYLHL